MLKLIAAAPFLAPAFTESLASSAGPETKKRVVMVMFHKGAPSELWVPSDAAAKTMDLSKTCLSSLADVKDKVVVVKKLQSKAGMACQDRGIQDDKHWNGPQAAYAAQVDFDSKNKGVSLDQHIVNKVKFPTQRRNIPLGVILQKQDMYQPVFYQAKGSPASIFDDPYAAINSVFGSFMSGSTTSNPVSDLAAQKSILDVLTGDLGRLSKRLAGSEKEKLEAHLTLVRSSEMSLGTNMNGGDSASCKKLGAPASKLAINNMDNLPALAKIQMDLIAMAMACDISRVFCLHLSSSYDGSQFNWGTVATDNSKGPQDTQGLHRLAHSNQGDPDRALFGKAVGTYVEIFAYLLAALKKIPDGSGTLLDNSISMITSDYGDSNSHQGNDHSFDNLPMLIGGGGGGMVKSGQVLDAKGASHTQVFGSVMSYFGIDRTASPTAPGDGAFGDAALSYAPLPGLLV
jgi:Protein of unknown function (DUF1552)